MKTYKVWECMICGWEYDESKGWPEDNIAPGTAWEDIPDDWLCPECGVGKSDFEMVAVREIVAEETNDDQEAELAPFFSQVDASLDPLVIIGSGLAGYNLVKQFRALNSARPIMVITADDGAFYSKPALSTGFQKRKSAAMLVSNDAEQMARELDIDVRVHTRVQAIDRAAQKVITDSGNFAYHQLVFATGASCINPPVDGDAAGLVMNINDLHDYAKFRAGLVGKQRIAIIGAGLIGAEFCNDLSLAGYQVDTIDPMPHLLSALLPEEAARRVEQSFDATLVHHHFGTIVKSIDFIDPRKPKAGLCVTLSNGTQLTVDTVLSAIGVRPNIALAQACGLKVDLGIVTDAHCRTSDEGIFALGDCAQVNGQVAYYVTPLLHCAKALAQTLNGKPTAVDYGVMPVVVKTSVHPVMVAAAPRGTEGAWLIDQNDHTGVAARFCNNDGVTLGFALTGDWLEAKDDYVRLM